MAPNHPADVWGTDRTLFVRLVLDAVREGGRPRLVPLVGLRLSCDELAPWAGITPEAAAGIAAELGVLVDYLTVVRGSIFTVGATRPTVTSEPGFNTGPYPGHDAEDDVDRASLSPSGS